MDLKVLSLTFKNHNHLVFPQDVICIFLDLLVACISHTCIICTLLFLHLLGDMVGQSE